MENPFRYGASPEDVRALREVEREVDRIRVGEPLRGLFRPTLRCSAGPGVVNVSLTIITRDRGGGDAPFPIRHSQCVSSYCVLSLDPRQRERIVIDLVRHLWIYVLTHEFEESFFWDGERVLDPHREESARASLEALRKA